MRFKTLKYHYKANSNEINMLKLLCRISKNLYNATLYYLRQYYFAHNTIPSYFDTNKIFIFFFIKITPKYILRKQDNNQYNVNLIDPIF